MTSKGYTCEERSRTRQHTGLTSLFKFLCHSEHRTLPQSRAALYLARKPLSHMPRSRAAPLYCRWFIGSLVSFASIISLSFPLPLLFLFHFLCLYCFSFISFASIVSLSFLLPLWFPCYSFRPYATYYIGTQVAFRKLYKPLYFTYK
jgi:hypothetical protein